MKVLSFDVGIVNLAYCIMDIDEKLSTFKILKWDIINLVEQEESDKKQCSFIKRDKKCCDKSATHLINKNQYYCKAHVSKVESDKKAKKLKINSNKIGLDILGRSMFRKMDSIPEFITVDKVFIENQPTFINPTMKSISIMIYSYFLMKGMKPEFCSPAKKITISKEANKKVKKAAKDKVYKLTKGLGLKVCKSLIDEDELKMIDKYKKQDDMADAFLQGLVKAFIKIPSKFEDKIKLNF